MLKYQNNDKERHIILGVSVFISCKVDVNILYRQGHNKENKILLQNTYKSQYSDRQLFMEGFCTVGLCCKLMPVIFTYCALNERE